MRWKDLKKECACPCSLAANAKQTCDIPNRFHRAIEITQKVPNLQPSKRQKTLLVRFANMISCLGSDMTIVLLAVCQSSCQFKPSRTLHNACSTTQVCISPFFWKHPLQPVQILFGMQVLQHTTMDNNVYLETRLVIWRGSPQYLEATSDSLHHTLTYT